MTATSPVDGRSGSQRNEQHVIQVRRHWINLVWRAGLPGLLAGLCWGGSILAFRDTPGTAPDLSDLVGLGLLVLSLAPVLWIVMVYYDWANDYLAITKTHLVHYEQRYFLSQRALAVPFHQVQNVKARIPNVLLRQLDVGDLLIETAGPEGTIHFNAVKDPQKVQRQLLNLLGRPAPAQKIQAPVSAPPAKPLFQLRRHWFALAWRIAIPIVLTALLWGGAYLLSPNLLTATPGPGRLWGLGLLALSLVPIAGAVAILHDWRNDLLIVTREQIVHQEQRFVFWRSTTAVPLSQIQNIRVFIPEVLPRWLNMGSIILDTTDEQRAIRFNGVEDPRGLRDKIYKLLGRPAPTEAVEIPATFFQRLAFILERVLPTYPLQTAEGGLEWRRHPSILAWRTLVPGTLVMVLWLGAILALLGVVGPTPDLRLTIGLALLSLIPAAWGFIIYYDWLNDYLTIDREQIVHYEQHYIFRHETRVIPLQRVQNVRIRIPNVIARWLNVGEVIVDTAGQRGDIAFDGVKNPRQIQTRIFALRGRPEPTEAAELPKHPLARFLDRFLPIYPVRTSEGWIVYHRHPFVFLQRILWPLGTCLATALSLFWFIGMGWAGALPGIGTVAIPVLALGNVGSLLWLWYTYADWKNDYWIITDTHVIDVVARPFPYMSEDRRQARLQDIVDVRIEVPSIWARILRMGNVFAETAGQAENFVLQQMVNPKSVQAEMQRRQRAARVREQQAAEQARLVEQARFQSQVLETVEQAQRAALEEFERRVLEILEQRTGPKTPSRR